MISEGLILIYWEANSLSHRISLSMLVVYSMFESLMSYEYSNEITLRISLLSMKLTSNGAASFTLF